MAMILISDSVDCVDIFTTIKQTEKKYTCERIQVDFVKLENIFNIFLVSVLVPEKSIQWTYGDKHPVGPCCCQGWGSSLGHSAHSWVQWCGADSFHTLLHLSCWWPRNGLGQSGSAGRGCYTHSLQGATEIRERRRENRKVNLQ